VVAVGRGVFLTSVCAVIFLLALAVYVLSAMSSKHTAKSEQIQPTPIDDMLRRIMDDQQFDVPNKLNNLSQEKTKSTNVAMHPEVQQTQGKRYVHFVT